VDDYSAILTMQDQAKVQLCVDALAVDTKRLLLVAAFCPT
jgi:hypothetical protein